jgi:hypothetical protein
MLSSPRTRVTTLSLSSLNHITPLCAAQHILLLRSHILTFHLRVAVVLHRRTAQVARDKRPHHRLEHTIQQHPSPVSWTPKLLLPASHAQSLLPPSVARIHTPTSPRPDRPLQATHACHACHSQLMPTDPSFPHSHGHPIQPRYGRLHPCPGKEQTSSTLV